MSLFHSNHEKLIIYPLICRMSITTNLILNINQNAIKQILRQVTAFLAILNPWSFIPLKIINIQAILNEVDEF